LGGKYLFLNELWVERTAFDKQLGPNDVLPQSNIFFSQFLRIAAAQYGTHSINSGPELVKTRSGSRSSERDKI
jgi:hypothetical protein